MSRRTARILVTDAQDACGIAAIRCLGAAGYTVSGVSVTRRGFGIWSRDCSSRWVLPNPRDNLDAFIQGLDGVLSAEPHDVMICGRDETVYAVSKRRHQIAQLPRTGLPDDDVVQRALDKGCLTTEAAKVGLAVPEQRICENVEEALEAAREFGLPALVKPVEISFEVDGEVLRRPSRWVTDEAQVREACDAGGPSIVQRSVTGQVMSFGGVSTPDGLLGVVVSRYIRTWPLRGGHSSFTESIDPPPGLVEQVQALVAAIGWTGIFELEMIQDTAGAIHALDFNPRPYGSIALARPAGAPLCTIWSDWLLGDTVARQTGRPRFRFRFEEREALNLIDRLGRHDLRGAAGILRPRRHTVHATTSLSDPIPTLLGVGAVVSRVLRERSQPV